MSIIYVPESEEVNERDLNWPGDEDHGLYLSRKP